MHYILEPHHIFIRIKVFILMLVPGGLQLLIISTCFAWRPVTSINKSHVLTTCAHGTAILMHGFLFINIWLLICCDTGIYAIMFNNLTAGREFDRLIFLKVLANVLK